MSRLVDYLINQARKESENTEFSDFSGIDDTEFIQYLNDAQHRLQSVIVAQHPSVFVTETTQNTERSVESYTLPTDCFLGNKVTSVEFTSSGNDDDYYFLDAASIRQRTPGVEGSPSDYIRRSGAILLSPIPDTANAKIRLNYVKRINELDKRRGSVASSVVSGTSITSLIADVVTDSLDTESLDEHNYICIVDRNGSIKMKNIEVDTFNPGTGEISITSGFTFEDGESISVGDYIVGGQDTSTHSELSRTCERYLIKYCVWKILKRDSSVDYAEAQTELLAMESDIIASFSDIDDDVTFIPRLDTEGWD